MPDDDWYQQARAFRDRTGDDMREIYLSLLCFIGTKYPDAMPYALGRLNEVYPDGIEAKYSQMTSEPGVPETLPSTDETDSDHA